MNGCVNDAMPVSRTYGGKLWLAGWLVLNQFWLAGWLVLNQFWLAGWLVLKQETAGRLAGAEPRDGCAACEQLTPPRQV
jgi:hypothetical protein